jgi:flagellar basal-body rod protein FlgC
MNGALSIAASGLAAASLRLDVSAGNVANAETSGALPAAKPSDTAGAPSAYIPLRVDQVDVANGAVGGGTAATAVPVSPSYVPSYDPSAPYANSGGLVAAPNVELANEAVQQLIARYAFAANAGVVRTSSQMLQTLLDITA